MRVHCKEKTEYAPSTPKTTTKLYSAERNRWPRSLREPKPALKGAKTGAFFATLLHSFRDDGQPESVRRQSAMVSHQ